MFPALLRNENDNSDSVNRNAEFSPVLSEYTDTKALPPKRTSEDFEIEFK